VFRAVGGAARLAGVGIAALAGAAALAVREFTKQEDAERSLTAALQNQGQATEDNIRRIQEYASELQKATTIGDEAAVEIMSMGLNMGIQASRIEEATTAAVGLSRAYKIELRAAMLLVARASQGQTQMLTRYGIILDSAMSPQERFNALLKIGAANFGLAEAEAGTMSGRLAQARNSFGDLLETFGGAIVRGLHLTERFRQLSKGLDDLRQRLDSENTLQNWAEGANRALDVTASLIRDIFAGGELRATAFRDLGDLVRAAFSDAGNALLTILTQGAAFVGGLIADGFKTAVTDYFAVKKEAEAAFEAKSTPLERTLLGPSGQKAAIAQEASRIRAERAAAAGRSSVQAAIQAGVLSGQSRTGAALRAIARARGVDSVSATPSAVAPGTAPAVAGPLGGGEGGSGRFNQIDLGRVFEMAYERGGRADPQIAKLDEIKNEMEGVKDMLGKVFRVTEEGAA